MMIDRLGRREENLEAKKKPPSQAACVLILALAGCFHFFLALDAGLLIMLTLAHLSQNPGAGTLTLETLQRAFQRFVLFDSNLRHLYPPLRTSRLAAPNTRRMATVILLYARSL